MGERMSERVYTIWEKGERTYIQWNATRITTENHHYDQNQHFYRHSTNGRMDMEWLCGILQLLLARSNIKNRFLFSRLSQQQKQRRNYSGNEYVTLATLYFLLDFPFHVSISWKRTKKGGKLSTNEERLECLKLWPLLPFPPPGEAWMYHKWLEKHERDVGQSHGKRKLEIRE